MNLSDRRPLLYRWNTSDEIDEEMEMTFFSLPSMFARFFFLLLLFSFSLVSAIYSNGTLMYFSNTKGQERQTKKKEEIKNESSRYSFMPIDRTNRHTEHNVRTIDQRVTWFVHSLAQNFKPRIQHKKKEKRERKLIKFCPPVCICT